MRPDTGKCLHYYFYFIDADLGLIYLRVPTPACAGAGAAFLRVDDWECAQTLANGLSPNVLRRVLDRGACPRAGQRPDPWAQQCCPVLDVFAQSLPLEFHASSWRGAS